MNELIVSNEMGVLIPTRTQHDPKKFKGEHGLKDPDGILVRYCINPVDYALQSENLFIYHHRATRSQGIPSEAAVPTRHEILCSLDARIERIRQKLNCNITLLVHSKSMTAPPPRARSGSVSSTRYNTLRVLLGVLVALVLGALAFELSFVSPDALTANPEEYQDVLHVLDAAAAAEDSDKPPTGADAFYPDDVFDTDWSQRIKDSDILHEAALHRGCVKHKTSIISWRFGRTGENETQNLMHYDPQLLEKLRQCPDVDIFLPKDFVPSDIARTPLRTLNVQARMLPRWALEHQFQDEARNRTVTYHDLCPNTPMIFFNHYWEELPDAPDWPAAKPLYLMPNMEMYELESEHYWRADVILCKTALCARYLRKWFKQEGNPRGTRVLYTRHTTSNLALTYKSQLTPSEREARPDKNFSDVTFLHTAGTSIQKGTRQVLDCWLARPDLPRLELHMAQDLFDGAFKAKYAKRIDSSRNVVLHTGRLEPAAFGRLITDAAYFMCPSLQEGYGHYINQARSSRALIFTTDVAPMNELITPSSGALIKARAIAHDGQFLGGKSKKEHALRGVPGFVADFGGRSVCDAVTDLLKNTTPEERAKRADRALQQYYFDTVFFAQKMQELRDFARAHSHLGRLHGTLRRHEDESKPSPEPSERGVDVVRDRDGVVESQDAQPGPALQDDEDSRHVLYPDTVFETDWSQRISTEEILHEAALHRGCVAHKDSIVPWTFGQSGQNNTDEIVYRDDPQLLEKLRRCPDVDVLIPGGIRSYGYCEDAAAYTKSVLESRMLPCWVLEVKFQDEARNRSVGYHDLCPNTPMLFFNHYWEGLVDAPDWPVTKPLYLMPNIEMYELNHKHYWRADVILCKTAVCARYLRKWFRQEGNPRATRVIYTRHTTSNLALTLQSQMSPSEKDFSDVKLLHTAGTSIQKGTRQVLDCWLSRPDFPPLDIYMGQGLYNGAFYKYHYRVGNSTNIRVHTGGLSSEEFGRIITQGRYFLCPSYMEGYGHYINQARSSRAFIFTTDVAPMNELITSSSGALIRARAGAYGEQFLGGKSTKDHALRDVPGLAASFDSGAVCNAVQGVLDNTTPEERARRADKALQQYYYDTVFFAQSMQELRDYARARSHAGHLRQQQDSPVLDSSNESLTFYPEEIFDVDWSRHIKATDILHQSALHRGCVTHKNSIIPWTFGRNGQDEGEELTELVNRSDPMLLEKLRKCPDVDILLPDHLRNFGYCEDAAAYTKCTMQSL
ncbi:hypothetical protein GQ600_9356 [Phytophthora cactorum]|nr:hypothetical protein GQ600_9356 [Phytophthora cactorum]